MNYDAHLRLTRARDRNTEAKRALERSQCPKCSSPVRVDHDVPEVGGRSVRYCSRASCSWDDYDEREAEYASSQLADPDYDGASWRSEE